MTACLVNMANHESDCYLCNLPLEMGEHCQCDKYNEIQTHNQSSQICSNELKVQVLLPDTIEKLEVSKPVHCTSVERTNEPHKENLGEPTRRPYKCDECNASFSRYTLLTAHTRKHREGPPYICHDCSQNFENENDWLDHKESGCIIADTKYIQSQKKRQHSHSDAMKKKLCDKAPKENRCKCRHCSKSFKSVWIRNNHERNLHEGLRPHSCDECGKQFYRKFNLIVHKRKHSNDRPHECKICHKRFKASIGVKVHMEIHSDRRPFMCENCGKVFKTRSILECHRTIHTGETKFSCTVCGKSYRYRASLFIHMRTHTGHRPYNCSHCNAAFMVKSHLTEHLRIHTGERPFECEFCSACFSRSISLKKHLKSHLRTVFEMNIDKAMYHAKIQAHITPRFSFPIANDKPQLIPKVTHYMKDNIFLVAKECDSLNPYMESIVLYTDPPTNEMALVVVAVTSIGDGSTCIHEITKLLPEQSNKSTAKLTKSINLVEMNSNTQDQQILLLKDIQNNETLNFPDLPQVGNVQEDIDTIPVLSLPDETSNENVIEESVGLNHLSSYECYTGKASIDSRLCRDDWIVSQNNIDDTILRSDRIGIIGTTSVGQHNDLQIYSMNSERQESIINFTSNIDVECENGVYCEKIAGTILNHTSVKKEEVLMDNKIKSILLNQDISIVSNLTRADIEEQSNTCQLVAQLDGPETVDTSYENAKIKCYKNKRKPLRKCRYCDVSYRYTALLEAHEAKHEQQTKESVNTDNENSLGEYYLCMSSTLGEDLPFRCEKCHSSFSFRSELRNHVKLHSSKYHYTCKKCHQAFQQEVFLAKHQCGRSFPNPCAISHNSQSIPMIPERSNKNSEVELKYKCDNCGKEFHKEFALKVHYRKHTGKRPFKCKDCKMRFISAKHCRIHRRIHRGEDAYVCETCNKSFRYRINFHNHMKMCQAIIETKTCKDNPNNNIQNAKLSDFKVSDTVNPENIISPLHKLQGELMEDYAVKLEPQEVVGCLKEKIVDHIDKFEVGVNKDEISLCEIQENSSVYHLLGKDVLENLQTNKAMPNELQEGQSSETIGGIHLEAPPDFPNNKKIQGLLRCEHCPKVFKFKSILHIHTRSHTGAKPFCCSVCGKSFSKKSNMAIHMRIHTGERPFLCDYCGKCFTYKYTLSAHKRLHTQERPFICGVCGKSFRYEASRHVHLKRHANDRAFKCDLCPKAFVAKVDMEDHRRTHTGEKPYKCEHCERKFTVRHHLTEHRRLHTGEKPYKCQYCTMTFARAATRKIHLQKHLKIIGEFL
ncbi:zinc finger protein 107 [Procambarus clarkii]|uniref:zinc finger protein 107 n=1 Tax=Procambarus clarkii TaxID=6728 RepID=UPI001E677031|nr:zinc finger protein 845-like [Procambarus clarkii]XP_045617438.1 zinc finger protein 845-like [Procambarus clarkii]